MGAVCSGRLYRLLREQSAAGARVERVMFGLAWTLVEISGEGGDTRSGLSFSPLGAPRDLPWSGTIAGREAAEVLGWLDGSDSCQNAVALATLNALANRPTSELLQQALPIACDDAPHLAVFEHFAPQLAGARVAVIGRYPGFERFYGRFDYVCIERRPGPGDLPAAAAATELPAADWVFVTASSIANGTLPELLSHAANARVVLMGPSLPWLPVWAHFGVDYLAGIEVLDAPSLWRIVAEAGGTRIFRDALRYRVLALD